ncbi:MAG TPA: TCR/Tet family MFS transporter [Steroidobacteraceae bacterium]|nr:TCR/Tet family MFS transporter [Steroidobacteraceae bacterium]
MTEPAAGRRAVVFIFITVLIDSIGFGLIIPVLPQLIVELTGLNMGGAAAYGGWLSFSYALLQFFAAPVLGNLSDRFGRRPVLLASLFALGVDYLVMGVAPTVGWLFLGRVVAGMAGASFTTAYAYLADVSTPEKRSQNFGLVGAAFGMGFIIGPAIGGLIGTLGPRAPFFAAAALALLNTGFGLVALPESLPPASRRPFSWARANPLGTLLQLAKYPVVLWLAAAAFFWQLGHQVLPNVWSFYTIFKFHWSTAAVGASLAFAGVVMVIGQGLLTRLIPRLGGDRRAAILGMLFGAITYLGYAFSTQGWMMYVSLLAWLPAALAYPSLNALMSREIPASAQGELQGGVASLFGLSSILGPPLMTELFDHFTSNRTAYPFPGAPFAAAALLVFVSIALVSRGLRAAPATSPG